jgi:hypothetical protein
MYFKMIYNKVKKINVLNLQCGPQYPAVHGVLRLIFKIVGERIVYRRSISTQARNELEQKAEFRVFCKNKCITIHHMFSNEESKRAGTSADFTCEDAEHGRYSVSLKTRKFTVLSSGLTRKARVFQRASLSLEQARILDVASKDFAMLKNEVKKSHSL